MRDPKALLSRTTVSDHGKRAFFIIFFLVLLTLIGNIKALFAWLDLKTVDFFFSLKPIFVSKSIDHPAMVIAKDQTFFERFGRDPDRSDYAAILGKLQKGGATVAALDLIFDQASQPEKDEIFAQALRDFPYPILAQHHLSRGKQTFEKVSILDQLAARPPWPLPLFKPFSDSAISMGSINILQDFDSTIRYLPLAFHPAEKQEFIPSLGFATYLAWLFQQKQHEIDQAIKICFKEKETISVEALLAGAPFPFYSTGHAGLDELIRNTEKHLLKRRIAHFSSTANENKFFNKKIAAESLEQPKKTWLALPTKRWPLIGNFHQPCLRLNFFKTPPPVIGDGIEQHSIGTVLKTEKDRENADKITAADIIIDENSPAKLKLDFDWSLPGNAEVSGQILNPSDESLPETDIRLEMTDSGFWSQISLNSNGTFKFSNLPEGRFIINVVFRYPHGWIKSTISASASNEKPLRLPDLLHCPPSNSVKLIARPIASATSLYFFGETIFLQKTDASGSLAIFDPGKQFQHIPIDDEIQIEKQKGNILIGPNGKILANIVVATLPKEESWTNKFFFQHTLKTDISLPTSLDCRIAAFSKFAKNQNQKTIDFTIIPGESNRIEQIPELTKFEDRQKNIALFTKDGIEEITLISDTESVLTVPANKVVSLPFGNYRVFSSKKTERGKFNRLKAMFSGKVAFIGTTLQEDQDLVSTPINFFDPAFTVLPGVNLHANLFSGLVRNDFLDAVFFHSDRQPDFWPFLQALLTLPVLMLCNRVFSQKGAFWGATSIIVLSSSWSLTCFIAFLNGLLIPLFFPVLNIVSFGVLRGYYAWEIARRKENETRSTFGRFISSAVVEEILKTPESLKPGGEKKELTVMFTDLAGFTTISEKLAPEQLTELMNEYLGAMTELLFQHHGTLDKYIGDAIMAFWNHPKAQPNHPELAARCAIAMQQKLGELREKWLTQGLPEVQVRAGINTSTCMVGFIGSDVQMNFTCLGDGVNLASRLEGANKNYGTLNMVAESVKQRLDPKVFSTRFLDYLAVKGKDQPIKVYELRGLQKNETKNWQEASPLYHSGVELYLQRNFNAAIQEFAKVLQLVPADEPTTIFIERCQHFLIEPPPENWDGRFILKTK